MRNRANSQRFKLRMNVAQTIVTGVAAAKFRLKPGRCDVEFVMYRKFLGSLEKNAKQPLTFPKVM
jgi:hypothetical protein